MRVDVADGARSVPAAFFWQRQEWISMQALVFDAAGEPTDVLRLQNEDVPELKPGLVRVKMLASPINPSDLMFIRGQYTIEPQCPASPGFEGVGIVEASGGGLLGRFMLGKRVAVLNRRGGNWAEQAVLPVKQVIPLKSALSLEQAATFFVNPATAFILTRMVLKVPAGEWLVQTAAGSELGKMVIRLGRRFGFRTLNIVRRAEQAAELQQLGADAVLVFDPQRDDARQLSAQIRRLTNGGTKCAIDPVGGIVATALTQSLSKQGRLLLFGTLSGEPLSLFPRDLMTPGATVEGFWLGNFMESLRLPAKLKLVKTLTQLIVDGTLSSEITSQHRLADYQAALTAAQQPGRVGKVLLKMNID